MHLSASWVPWIVFAFGMFLAFVTIYSRTPSFRQALLGSLFVGKTFAIVYWISGLDRTLLTIYLIDRHAPWIVKTVRITACETIFLSFLVTALTIASWPLIARHLPREIRRAVEAVQG
ncbi:MAG: hypothetical protein GXO32_01075 [Crenarchaeota archaeon]|nr:hypothetical protein [Thermoproteota archaeon]